MSWYIAQPSVWTQYSRTRDTPPGRITLHHTAISRHITPLHDPLQDHVKGKPHKRRLHALKTDPYTIEESLRAAGISILHPPSSIHHLHVLCSPPPHSSHLLPPTPVNVPGQGSFVKPNNKRKMETLIPDAITNGEELVDVQKRAKLEEDQAAEASASADVEKSLDTDGDVKM